MLPFARRLRGLGEEPGHEGWVLLPGHYDDDGFSGGSMERPGLP